MKKIGDIMEEMGFNPNSTPSSKAAFIKYLAKEAYNVDLKIPDIYKTEEESGEATLDSFLNKEVVGQSEKPKNVVNISSKKKPEADMEQLELNLGDLKIAE